MSSLVNRSGAPRPLRIALLGENDRSLYAIMSAHARVPGLEIAAISSEETGAAQGRSLAFWEALIRNPEIDATYLAVAPALREDFAVASLEHGKHVCCEAPVGLNAEQARYVLSTSRSFGRVFFQAEPWLSHPAVALAVDYVRSGRIGRLKRLQSSIAWPAEPENHIRVEQGLCRLGFLGVRWAEHIAGSEPREQQADRVYSSEGADIGGTARLLFAEGIEAEIVYGSSAPPGDLLAAVGDAGAVRIANLMGLTSAPVILRVDAGENSWDVSYPELDRAGELRAFVAAVAGGLRGPADETRPVRQLDTLTSIAEASAHSVAGWTPASSLLLTEADVQNRTWRFGRRDAAPYARHLKLLPGGRIAGHKVETEASWAIDGGSLLFLDRLDRPSTLFDQVFRAPDGRLTLHGAFRLSPEADVVHTLREIPPPARMCPPEHAVELTSSGMRRPNLLILRANERSRHTEWARDITDAQRNWDLCVSWYGSEANYRTVEAEHRAFQPDDTKFPALWSLLHQASPLWAYERVALFDDDLEVTWSDLNQAFALTREFSLDLAQPSLDPAGFNSYPLLVQRPEFLLRYTSFVEAMAPIFSRDALRACVATFRDAGKGSGLDNVWPKLLGEPKNRIGVLDQIRVLHTRPTGSAYSLARSVAAGNELQRRYAAATHVEQYGGVWASPRSGVDGE